MTRHVDRGRLSLSYVQLHRVAQRARAPALFTGPLSDQRQDSVWVSADPPAGGGNVGGSVEAVEADGEVTERGHHLWAVTGPDLGVILGESHVPNLLRGSACGSVTPVGSFPLLVG